MTKVDQLGTARGSSGRRPQIGRTALAVVLMAMLAPACGGSTTDASTEPLSATAQLGLETARAAGCAACHGSNGEGVEGLGPAFAGVFGTTVALADGTAVVADRQYLERSIVEPDAQITAGYTLPMPPYELPAEDLAAILDYLEEAR